MNLKLKYQKYRFRRGLFGRIILQVSHGRKALTSPGDFRDIWRDAKMTDFKVEDNGD